MAQTDEELEFALPRRYGRYVLFDRIGRGGMADIYLARGTTQVGAARLTVVKLVLAHLARDPAFAAMLVSEARLAARLSHANVVQTFDLGREEDRLYIAMEYVEGYDLTQLLKKLREKKVGMPAEFGFFVVMEMLRGLDYAHRRTDDRGAPLGIVHRDVSPSNVLISLEGEVKLCDFGIARAVSDLAELPEGALEGKAAYMSPEHARGERVDARADVFSATTILWEILAGRRMYKAKEGQEVLDVARSGDVPPLPDRGLPNYARLSAIVSKGLAPDREQRYASAAMLLDDLDDYTVENHISASPMRFGQFLTDQFEQEIVAVRRERERAAMGLTQPETQTQVEVIPTIHDRASAPELAEELAPELAQADDDDNDDDTPGLDEIASKSQVDIPIKKLLPELDDAPFGSSIPMPAPVLVPVAEVPDAEEPPPAPARSPALYAVVGIVVALIIGVALALRS